MGSVSSLKQDRFAKLDMLGFVWCETLGSNTKDVSTVSVSGGNSLGCSDGHTAEICREVASDGVDQVQSRFVSINVIDGISAPTWKPSFPIGDMHKGATTAEQSRRVCEHVEPVEVADSELWSWLGMPLSTADESDFEDLAVV